MKYILDSAQMKKVDKYSIEKAEIPSLVLMERAALAVTDIVTGIIDKMNDINVKVLCIAGKGNNGADALAVARQLNEQKIKVCVGILGNPEKSGTVEFQRQCSVLKHIGIECDYIEANWDFKEYNIIIDGIFGIGLSKDVGGMYADIINRINEERKLNNIKKVIAIDAPSGIDASTGDIRGCAIKADITVTFGYNKIGLSLFPGKEYAGKVIVHNIGFAPKAIEEIEDKAFTYSDEDLNVFRERKADSNKGSNGKILIIAGSKDMAGAACLSAFSAFRSGCGMVKVFTHVNNRNVILQHVPEAIVDTYDDDSNIEEMADTHMKWASLVVLGPGLSMSDTAVRIVRQIIKLKLNNYKNVPLVVDADGLNIISKCSDLKDMFKKNSVDLKDIIFTPHMGEMSRLTGVTIDSLKKNSLSAAKELAYQYNVICVLKDAVTVVSDGKEIYINNSGNSGMATAGSGDVLTGVMAGMLAGYMHNDIEVKAPYYAACMAVYIHGRAGDEAAEVYGRYGMKAMDIAIYIPNVIGK